MLLSLSLSLPLDVPQLASDLYLVFPLNTTFMAV